MNNVPDNCISPLFATDIPAGEHELSPPTTNNATALHALVTVQELAIVQVES